MNYSAGNRKITAQRQSRPCLAKTQGGFTLVELLVSVALVLLMMVMFTEIFQIASSSITTQRGLSENDQRARMLTTLIQSDLNKRTFQNIIPFAPSEKATAFKLSDFTDRRGYLVISENDPNNDSDDLIQFTTDANITSKLLDTTPYYGKATVLGGDIFAHPNQPETDDAKISPDRTSVSPYAEICYFMRGGNLYRRTLLIRKPLDLETTNSTQPQTAGGAEFFDPANSFYSGNFWNDFDFSVYRFGSPTPYANFHDVKSLDNTLLEQPRFSLGRTNYRFGYNHATGLPREYVDDIDGAAQFIGRFTHQETSHPDFLYPQAPSNVSGNTNPMSPSSSDLTLDRNTNVVNQYAATAGSRRSEDLVLSNVIAFDIKLFDEALGQFTDIGSSIAVDYASSATTAYQNNNSDSAFATNIYDTWHIEYDIDNADGDGDHATGQDVPPFRPVDGSGNPRALKAIQITIRYIDISSQQLRQMTIIHPLRNLLTD
ncbi:prepilin-type N-terminal cleavage/methylation domain-containing protein [uncultured Gimesia sp.]|uniref:prepilin-type N-terminal cleavage/methylation domain-containing protein n=1 Tax=uncultured Gimesia sp. TaxID=1678688 RepID=UPI0030DA5E3A|tara:strand:+ start:144219 stop:145679 length:1461 start_codon:yes stop_codon:yes gene_type:complete